MSFPLPVSAVENGGIAVDVDGDARWLTNGGHGGRWRPVVDLAECKLPLVSGFDGKLLLFLWGHFLCVLLTVVVSQWFFLLPENVRIEWKVLAHVRILFHGANVVGLVWILGVKHEVQVAHFISGRGSDSHNLVLVGGVESTSGGEPISVLNHLWLLGPVKGLWQLRVTLGHLIELLAPHPVSRDDPSVRMCVSAVGKHGERGRQTFDPAVGIDVDFRLMGWQIGIIGQEYVDPAKVFRPEIFHVS